MLAERDAGPDDVVRSDLAAQHHLHRVRQQLLNSLTRLHPDEPVHLLDNLGHALHAFQHREGTAWQES